MPSKRSKRKRDYKVQYVPSTGAGQEHRTNKTKRTVSLGSQNLDIKGGDPDSGQKTFCYQLNLKNFKEKSECDLTPEI